MSELDLVPIRKLRSIISTILIFSFCICAYLNHNYFRTQAEEELKTRRQWFLYFGQNFIIKIYILNFYSYIYIFNHIYISSLSLHLNFTCIYESPL